MKAADRLKAALGANIADSVATDRTGAPALPTTGGPPANPYAGLDRLKGAVWVPVGLIDPDPDQPRREFDEEALDRLGASMKARGQLAPCRARRDPGTGRWVLVAGERRYRAALRVGLDRLAVWDEDRTLSPDQLVEIQLTENCLREDLKPIEQAKAFQLLMNLRGWKQLELADHLNLSRAAVSKALALLKLPEDVQADVDDGIIPARTAYEIVKTPDPEQRDAMVEESRARSRTEGARPKTTSCRYVVPGGKVVVTLDGAGGSGDVVAALRAALRAAQAEGRDAA